MRQIILDTETTGISPKQGHRIIEIGAVEMINRQLTGNHFHYYINPQRDIDEGAKKVHGITEDFLKDKPLFKDIVEEFIAYVDGAELIIHNAPFDVGFINHEFKLLSSPPAALESICAITDTLVMARKKHVGQRNSLDALCKRYQIDNSNRTLHGALLDSEILALVYLAMTGGQNSLFGEAGDENSLEHTHTVSYNPLEHPQQTRVIQASDEELKTHKEYLAKMREKGECVWEE